jgi:hypothetical protein
MNGAMHSNSRFPIVASKDWYAQENELGTSKLWLWLQNQES